VSAAWFAALGAPLKSGAADDLAACIAGLLLPADTPPTLVASWSQTDALLRAPGGDMTWWDREEAERSRLMLAVGDDLAVMHILNRATDTIAEAVHAAATAAAARQNCADPYIIRVAAGAAMQAAHQSALATMAGEGDHFFLRKYALFAAGRWPLGCYGGSFHIF
jgi:hypothetical protein